MLTSPFDNDDTIILTQKSLTSLCARYPDITFDTNKRQTQQEFLTSMISTDDFNSSPISTQADGANRSQVSGSTAQTTPPRLLQAHGIQRQPPPGMDTVPGYLQHVRHADLPDECRLCFDNLAQSIGAISSGLVPSTNGRYRINNTYFGDRCMVLLRELESLTTRTQLQVQKVANLKTLIVFTTEPTDDMVLPIYRQRVQLVIKLTALPSTTEHNLIRALAHLYNIVVYMPLQQLYDAKEIEAPTIRTLNAIYDLLFTWSTTYRCWCLAMRDLKSKYMTPLVDRLLASEVLVANLKYMHRAKSSADTMMLDPHAPSMLPVDFDLVDERMLRKFNLIPRTTATSATTTTRSPAKITTTTATFNASPSPQFRLDRGALRGSRVSNLDGTCDDNNNNNDNDNNNNNKAVVGLGLGFSPRLQRASLSPSGTNLGLKRKERFRRERTI